MIGKIVSIKNSIVYVQLTINIYQSENLISKNVTFGDRYIGEVTAVSNSIMEVSLIGEIVSNKFIPGSVNIPPVILNNEENKVVVKETNKEKHDVKVIDDTLKITLINDKELIDYIGINIYELKVDIYLSNSSYNDLLINNSIGDINIPNYYITWRATF